MFLLLFSPNLTKTFSMQSLYPYQPPIIFNQPTIFTFFLYHFFLNKQKPPLNLCSSNFFVVRTVRNGKNWLLWDREWNDKFVGYGFGGELIESIFYGNWLVWMYDIDKCMGESVKLGLLAL